VSILFINYGINQTHTKRVVCRCFADAGTIGPLEESTGISNNSVQSKLI